MAKIKKYLFKLNIEYLIKYKIHKKLIFYKED